MVTDFRHMSAKIDISQLHSVRWFRPLVDIFDTFPHLATTEKPCDTNSLKMPPKINEGQKRALCCCVSAVTAVKASVPQCGVRSSDAFAPGGLTLGFVTHLVTFIVNQYSSAM